MSRIEEAMRRSGGSVRAADGRPIIVEQRAHAVDPAILEGYATETSGERRAPRVSEVRKPDADAAAGAVVLRVPEHGRLVVSPEISPLIVEQYRRLAAVLHELQGSHKMKALMVTSALPREGKTLTVVNLALTLSESYRQRVLVIDADLRHPSVHQALGVPNMLGLGDVLRRVPGPLGNSDGPLPIVELTKNLSVLPAGRPDSSPTAKIMSARFQALVKESVDRFDWVLLDTPPVGLLTDAQLVARLCDGVLFVIGAGSTPYQLVKDSIAELGADRIVGTVLNRAEGLPAHSDHYAHYYAPGSSRK